MIDNYIVETIRIQERDKIFSAMDTLFLDRKTWNFVDVFNKEDFKQSIKIELKKQDAK